MANQQTSRYLRSLAASYLRPALRQFDDRRLAGRGTCFSLLLRSNIRIDTRMEVQSPFQIVWEKTGSDTKFPDLLLQRIAKYGSNLAMVKIAAPISSATRMMPLTGGHRDR